MKRHPISLGLTILLIINFSIILEINLSRPHFGVFPFCHFTPKNPACKISRSQTARWQRTHLINPESLLAKQVWKACLLGSHSLSDYIYCQSSRDYLPNGYTCKIHCLLNQNRFVERVVPASLFHSMTEFRNTFFHSACQRLHSIPVYASILLHPHRMFETQCHRNCSRSLLQCRTAPIRKIVFA